VALDAASCATQVLFFSPPNTFTRPGFPLSAYRLALIASVALAPQPLQAQASPAPAAAPAPAVRFTGYIQARETYRDGQGLTASINRARLTALGKVTPGVSWRIQGEFRTGSIGTGKASVSLQDAYIRYETGQFGIQAGQFKTPFTREFLTSLADVETADRATVVDSLAPKRDIGVMGDYALGSISTLTLGVFNGEGQNVTANTDSTLLWVGRVTARPVAYLTLGLNAAQYGSDSTRYGIDGSLQYKEAALQGEYLGQHRDTGGPDDTGWYAQATYRVLRWLQLVVKQEDFRRPAISAAVRNVGTTGGVNVELGGGKVRLLSDYVSRTIGTPGTRQGALITQAQVKF
jgi:Phosphate-selective porin O and P